MGVACRNVCRLCDRIEARGTDAPSRFARPDASAARSNTPCCWRLTRAGTRARTAGGPRASQPRRLVHLAQQLHLRLEQPQRGAHATDRVAGSLQKLFAIVEWLAAVAVGRQARRKTSGRDRAVAALTQETSRRPACRGAARRCRAPVPQSARSTPRGRSSCEATSSSSCASSKITAAASGRMPASGAPRGLLPHRKIGKEQVVIDDDDVRLERAAAHLGDEAAAIIGTGRPQAGLAARVELVPQRARFRQLGKLRAVAGFGRLLPLGDLPVLVDLFETRQDRLIAQGDELVAAEVVGAALHVADAQTRPAATPETARRGNRAGPAAPWFRWRR